MDPFAIFSLPRIFAIDLIQLRQRYLALTAEHHPDRFVDPLKQADASERIAVINQAYELLKDPQARAETLLMLLGGPAKETDKSLPPELLEEMLDIREVMESASSHDDQAMLGQLHERAATEVQERLHHIESYFDQILSCKPDLQSSMMKQIRLELNALRYYQRLCEQTSA